MLTAVHVIVQRQQEILVKLKLVRILSQQLIRRVYELCKHRREFFAVTADVAATVAEFVAE